MSENASLICRAYDPVPPHHELIYIADLGSACSLCGPCGPSALLSRALAAPSTVIPLVDGGTEGFAGHVRVIYPCVSACFECTLDLFPPQQARYCHQRTLMFPALLWADRLCPTSFS